MSQKMKINAQNIPKEPTKAILKRTKIKNLQKEKQ